MTRAITRVGESHHSFGDMKATIRDIDVTSYTTGGETVTAADLGLARLDMLIVITTEIIANEADWLPATNRFRIKTTVTGVELGSAANGGTFRVLAVGK